MVVMAGTYQFVSQDNFDKYLTSAGVGTLYRMAISKTRPEIEVQESANSFTFTTKTSFKDVKTTFTLGMEYECDPGIGRVAKYITIKERDDTLVTKEVHNPDNIATRKFTADGKLIMTMTAKGVTATRIFKRI